MNKLTITRESIRPNNAGKIPHLQLNKEKEITLHYDALSVTQPMTCIKGYAYAIYREGKQKKKIVNYERAPGVCDTLGPGQTTRFFTRFFTQQKIEEKIEPFGHLVE